MGMKAKLVEVYSDISNWDEVTTFCVQLHVTGRPPQTFSGVLHRAKTTNGAELSATALGLNLAPPAELAIVYSDQKELADWLERGDYPKKLRQALESIERLCAKFDAVDVRYVHRKHPVHAECHRGARKKLRAVHRRPATGSHKTKPPAPKRKRGYPGKGWPDGYDQKSGKYPDFVLTDEDFARLQRDARKFHNG